MDMNYDDYCKNTIDKDPNMIIAWYLMASYLYYIQNRSILSDQFFDKLAKLLEVKWDKLNHRHKSVLEKFKEGGFQSAFQLKDQDYPSIVKGAATRLLYEELQGVKK